MKQVNNNQATLIRDSDNVESLRHRQTRDRQSFNPQPSRDLETDACA